MGNPIPALNSMGTGMEKKVSTIVKWGWGWEGSPRWRVDPLPSLPPTNNKIVDALANCGAKMVLKPKAIWPGRITPLPSRYTVLLMEFLYPCKIFPVLGERKSIFEVMTPRAWSQHQPSQSRDFAGPWATISKVQNFTGMF
jgi:hypothetical protein